MNRHIMAGTLVALTLALALASRALAQEGPEARMEEHQARMEEHQARMQEHREAMEEAQARLDTLVAAMNSATGEARVDAIAAVVAELAAHHRMMGEHMREMMGHGMMGHGMMGHDEKPAGHGARPDGGGS